MASLEVLWFVGALAGGGGEGFVHRCSVIATPVAGYYQLEFEVHNGGHVPVRWGWYRPFMDFQLEVVGPGGALYTVEQPAIDLPVQPEEATVPAGDSMRLASVIRLHFAPGNEPVDSLFTWTVRHPPTGVTLRTKLALQGPPVAWCETAL